LSSLFGREPVYLWEGASIPLVGALRDVSGGSAVLVGFGMEEDLIHAPNESFSLEQIEHGFHFVTHFIGNL
jgi:acetylornithine deacetylase/succinyl-diaminopimelate desuccinylase-like protein